MKGKRLQNWEWKDGKGDSLNIMQDIVIWSYN